MSMKSSNSLQSYTDPDNSRKEQVNDKGETVMISKKKGKKGKGRISQINSTQTRLGL